MLLRQDTLRILVLPSSDRRLTGDLSRLRPPGADQELHHRFSFAGSSGADGQPARTSEQDTGMFTLQRLIYQPFPSGSWGKKGLEPLSRRFRNSGLCRVTVSFSEGSVWFIEHVLCPSSCGRKVGTRPS